MISSWGLSQNEEDALRYSQTYFGGTARNISMAGAMTAIGGDYSASSQNPASLARFNKNNFSFTPLVEMNTVTSSFYGNTDGYRSTKMKIGNFSYLKAYKIPENMSNGWLTLQLGLGYQRINSFAGTKRYSGEIDSSIIHNFINDANGTTTEHIYNQFPFGAGLAYDTYAIDPDTNNFYTTQLKGNSIHKRTIETNGGIDEYSFAMSANYQNKFYLGGTFNINRVNYESSFTHNEDFVKKDSIWLNSIDYLGYLNTKGYGVNVKIGGIYLPSDKLRIGFAIHTPTFYKLNDQWGNDMKAYTDDPDYPVKYIKDIYKPIGEYDYLLRTPLKANISVGYIIKKKASVGMEVEYINYRDSKLKSVSFSEAPYNFIAENTQIKNIYQQRLNLKIGGEYRVNPMLYLRGGYAYYASPYTTKSEVNTTATQFISGGFGLNFGAYYFDFGITHKNLSYDYFAYNPDLKGSKARFTDNNLNFSASIGFRFE